jgi:prepilin-type N-terminal cleavage/methylation domain-containing protein
VFHTARSKRVSGLSGFTLIELLVVILIIGTLANIALPNYLSIRKKAQAVSVVSDFQVIRYAGVSYYTEHGAWPGSGGWGGPPPGLADYIPDDFDWNRHPELEVRYAWFDFGPDPFVQEWIGGRSAVGAWVDDPALFRAIQGVYDGKVFTIGGGAFSMILFIVQPPDQA